MPRDSPGIREESAVFNLFSSFFCFFVVLLILWLREARTKPGEVPGGPPVSGALPVTTKSTKTTENYKQSTAKTVLDLYSAS